MSTIKNYKKIPKDLSSNDDLDFDFLKKTGVEYIEAMGGGLWSDLNDHDPGITMLEMLSYAITDLGARMDLPIETLIASKEDLELRNQFYRAEEILPTCPVTPTDYRKLFIDIDGVRNCWLVKVTDRLLHVDCTNNILSYSPFEDETIEKTSTALQGLNCLLVNYEEDADTAVVDQQILNKYHANRNLCEDLVEIKSIQNQPIAVCAAIELEREADQNKIHAQIIDALQQYFATEIFRYSLKEMLEKGYRMDEIFDGPLLTNGFIDSQELKKADLRSEVRLSDIVNLIMSLEGVISISNITMQGCGITQEGSEWLICIDPFFQPVLSPTPDMGGPTGECELQSVFNYKKDVLPVQYDPELVADELDAILEARIKQNTLASLDMFPSIPQGNVLEIGDTTTIMNDFPETYGIGPYGLPANASITRKAQAKQLKGYLLFFDQILATYFAHLGKIKDLFSMNSGNAPTYFTQAVKDVKGFEELVNDYPENDDAFLSEKLISLLDGNIARRNEVLDHLLARFAEQFSEYAFILNAMYGANAEEMLVESKEQFLAEYVSLSRRRGKGENLNEYVWETTKVSGLQHRVARLSGIEDFSRRDLFEFDFPWIQNLNPGYSWSFVDSTSVSEENLFISGISFEKVCEAIDEALKVAEIFKNPNLEEFSEFISQGLVVDQVFGPFTVLEVAPYSLKITIDGRDIEMPRNWDTTQEIVDSFVAFANYVTDPNTIDSDLKKRPEEGMFVVEHNLLLPPESISEGTGVFLPICAEDCSDSCGLDPYSFRVSIILPGNAERFDNADYRNFMNDLIRKEVPSHILPRICWIDTCQLDEFQDKYRNLIEAQSSDTVDETVLSEFLNIFTQLRNAYPGGRLFDCTSDDITGKIVLGRSNI